MNTTLINCVKKYKKTHEGFEVDAVLVSKVNGKKYREPFPIKVNSLNEADIQPVIDYWKNHLKKKNDSRYIVVRGIYRIEKIKLTKSIKTNNIKP